MLLRSIVTAAHANGNPYVHYRREKNGPHAGLVNLYLSRRRPRSNSTPTVTLPLGSRSAGAVTPLRRVFRVRLVQGLLSGPRGRPQANRTHGVVQSVFLSHR